MIVVMPIDSNNYTESGLSVSLRQDLTRRRHLWMLGEWEIPDNIDTTGFDFSWRPDYYDRPYIHEFGTQWQKTGGPRFVIPEAEGVKYQSHQRVRRLPDLTNWEVPASIAAEQFDFSWHPDATEPPLNYEFGTQWQPTGGPVYRNVAAEHTKLIADQTAVRLPNLRRWIIHQEIDKASFDFSWHPDHRDPPFNYVFGNHLYSANVMPTLTYRVSGATQEKYIDTHPARLVTHEFVEYTDSIVDLLKTHEFKRAFAVFVPEHFDTSRFNPDDYITDGRTLHIIDRAIAIVPELAQTSIGYSLADYQHVKLHTPKIYTPLPLDVVFISNGESVADENYERLKTALADRPNRLFRVHGVKGRVASQHVAAEIVDTNWYFLVNAKLEVNPNFKWNWQPDPTVRRQHYIFTANNPVIGLCYGHMAVVANNRQLTLQTQESGLDFTMSAAHRSVSLVSGTARYETDPWTRWRTAFRETVKLLAQGDPVSVERAETWCVHEPAAREARDFYHADPEQARLTYDWAWLEDLYQDKYKQQE